VFGRFGQDKWLDPLQTLVKPPKPIT
jgi:hypothetical protein